MAAVLAWLGSACATTGFEVPEHRVERAGLGTQIAVLARDHDVARAARGIQAAFAETEILERGLSDRHLGSEIVRLNDGPRDEWVPVAPDTAELLRRARAIARATDGAYDPTLGPLAALWDLDGPDARRPRPDEIQAARESVGWWRLQVDDTLPRVKLAGEETLVVAQGIAAGFIADRALVRMRASGVPAGMVRVGNHVVCYGGRGKPWEIAIQHPDRRSETLGTFAIESGAVSTVEPGYRRLDDERVLRLLDPRTGQPVNGTRSVTVLASTAALAQATANALFVLAQDAPDFLREHDELRALILFDDEVEFASRGLPKK